LLPGFLQRAYRTVQKRLDDLEIAVGHLEVAVDAILVNSKYVPGDDIGFNGQRHRKCIFAEITSILAFDAIVETGTWLGDTTAYMAQTARVPVHSCEVSPRFHALAKMRLVDVAGVHLELSDSRRFLQTAARGDLAGKRIFFYLDAHWYDDMPLNEEIEIITGHWSRFVIMIDDFMVPDDPSYGYDAYRGRPLDLELLQPAIGRRELVAFFPAARSADETGAQRGCVVLAPKGELAQELAQLASLREWHAGKVPTAGRRRPTAVKDEGGFPAR
jgi:hypothetical protein